MSLYFFASEKDEIKALVGIKALIIPFDIASKIREKLDRIEQNKQTLETEFKNCLEKEIHSEELKEEYNHFKCLNHSKVAKFFYVRNVMLRHTYNSCVGKKITGLIQSHPVLKDVLAYWIDYAYFHYVAFPIIEGAYLRHSQEEKEKLEEQVLYESRIKKFLMEKQGSLTAQEVPYRNIGRQLDRNFCLLLRGGRKVLEDLEFKDTINEKNSYFFKSSFLLFHMFASLLKRRAFWLNVGRALFKKAKFIYPHILARLLPGNDKKQTGGQLPSILSKEGAISPSGFYYGKYLLKSHEQKYPSTLHGCLANLLWHILSRCAVISCLITLDVSEEDIFLYFKKLRKFNWTWTKNAEDAEFKMALLDTEIIDRVLEQFTSEQKHSPWERIPILETIAIDIFQKTRRSEFRTLNAVGSPFHRAINCSYMLI